MGDGFLINPTSGAKGAKVNTTISKDFSNHNTIVGTKPEEEFDLRTHGYFPNPFFKRESFLRHRKVVLRG